MSIFTEKRKITDPDAIGLGILAFFVLLFIAPSLAGVYVGIVVLVLCMRLLCILLRLIWRIPAPKSRPAIATSQAPPALAAPAPPPTPTDDYVEAHRRYIRNCQLILDSALEAGAKSAALKEEQRVLDERIKQVMS